MMALIDCLDPVSQDKLKELRERLNGFYNNTNSIKKGDIEKAFSELMVYLHNTYLSEVSKGVIPASILKKTQKTPEPAKHPKVLSSELE